MHDRDLRDVVQRQRPVHRRIAAAGDHHALAGEAVALADVILHAAACLVGGEAVERRAVGAEGAGAGGDDHRAGAHRVALIGGQREVAGLARQAGDAAAEQAGGGERRDLLFELGDEVAGLDRRMGGDVVDRLFRVQRRALAAGLAERVDQHAADAQHAELEHREQPDRSGADDRDIGVDCGGGHLRPVDPGPRPIKSGGNPVRPRSSFWPRRRRPGRDCR